MSRQAHTLQRLALIAVLALLAPHGATAQAADDPGPTPSAPAAADETATPADPETVAGAKAGPAAAGEAGGDVSADGEPSGDVFVPTEEISEDYAVSFPVDI